MVLERPRAPLVARDMPDPVPGPAQVLLQVRACAVCRTDLHIIDGELHEPKLPLVLGHEIVGTVAALGDDATRCRCASRRSVAGLDLRCLQILSIRSREPLHSSTLYRLPDRWWLRALLRGRRALLF